MVSFAQGESAAPLNNFSKQKAELSIYPNPTKDVIIVNNVVTLGIKEIELFNLLGEKVKISIVSGLRDSIKMDLTNLKAGVYFLKAYNQQSEEVRNTKIKKI